MMEASEATGCLSGSERQGATAYLVQYTHTHTCSPSLDAEIVRGKPPRHDTYTSGPSGEDTNVPFSVLAE